MDALTLTPLSEIVEVMKPTRPSTTDIPFSNDQAAKRSRSNSAHSDESAGIDSLYYDASEEDEIANPFEDPIVNENLMKRSLSFDVSALRHQQPKTTGKLKTSASFSEGCDARIPDNHKDDVLKLNTSEVHVHSRRGLKAPPSKAGIKVKYQSSIEVGGPPVKVEFDSSKWERRREHNRLMGAKVAR